MILEFFYLFFILALICLVISIVIPPDPENFSRLSAAILSTILFIALGFQSFAVQKIYILEVNQTLIEHTITITDTKFAWISFGMGIVSFINAFFSGLLIFKEVEE